MTYRPARRLADIEPFHVVELLTRARQLEAEGRDIIHMELTIFQALDYAAQLRMPPDTTRQGRQQGTRRKPWACRSSISRPFRTRSSGSSSRLSRSTSF